MGLGVGGATASFCVQDSAIELLRERHAWFEKLAGVYTALWWVSAGHIPGVDEAQQRLMYLKAHGPSEFAFTFQAVTPPSEAFQRTIDWAAFRTCAAR